MNIVLFFVIASCQQYPAPEEILLNIEAGNFTRAEEQIHSLITDRYMPDSIKTAWLDRIEIMDRICKDFSMTEEDVRKSLIRYFPELDDSLLRKWEADRSLEMRIIDGEKQYFRHADLNLFRLDMEAGRRRAELDGKALNKLSDYYSKYAETTIDRIKKSRTTVTDPKKFRVDYSLEVPSNTVPDGETIRCWLPFPAFHSIRQPGSKLVTANCNSYIIAPPETSQRTIYLKKKAKKDSAIRFEVSFEITTAAQWVDIKPEEIPEYDTSGQLFHEFTSERPPHIVFSDEIKSISKQIIKNETNPVKKVRNIFQWINDNITWASALEYSTIDCIPAYVLENRHGDCGMQSLLFITLARYNGIPAKWQSGWYMFPVQTNMHDWAEVYYEGTGWIPVDPSFGLINSDNEEVRWFYTQGMDPFRLIINEDFSRELYPPKQHLRSETVDFQRGEVEWAGGNLYFDQWDYNIEVTPLE
jgi:transglutaminase-like putative cysteine protease